MSAEEAERLAKTVRQLKAAEETWRRNRRALTISMAGTAATCAVLLILTLIQIAGFGVALTPLLIAMNGVIVGMNLANTIALRRIAAFGKDGLWNSMARAMLLRVPDYAETIGDRIALAKLYSAMDYDEDVEKTTVALCKAAQETPSLPLKQALLCTVQLRLAAQGLAMDLNPKD
jgi:hypothetical protein